MTALVVLAALVIVVLVLCSLREPQRPPPPVSIDPERAVRVAARLHAIRMRVAVASTRRAIRSDADRLRREIARDFDELSDQ